MFPILSQRFLPLLVNSTASICLVLPAQFKSARKPLIILVSIMASISDAFVPLLLAKTTLNISTQVGLLTLIGLSSKHGILIVDFANNRLRDCGDRRAAASRRCGQPPRSKAREIARRLQRDR